MAVLFIDPGELRMELALEACSTLPDGLGGFTETWTETATLFARIEPVTATSVFGAGQTLESVTTASRCAGATAWRAACALRGRGVSSIFSPSTIPMRAAAIWSVR